jgi:adenylate kinase family enzyme
VRSSGSKEATAAKNNIMQGLVEQGFIALEVNDLI